MKIMERSKLQQSSAAGTEILLQSLVTVDCHNTFVTVCCDAGMLVVCRGVARIIVSLFCITFRARELQRGYGNVLKTTNVTPVYEYCL